MTLTSHGENKVGSCDDRLFAALVDSLEGVCIDEGAICVQVLDILIPKGNTVAPVERADVVLNTLDKLSPCVFRRCTSR